MPRLNELKAIAAIRTGFSDGGSSHFVIDLKIGNLIVALYKKSRPPVQEAGLMIG